MADSFPRQYARTRGFNLGTPRSFSVADDGSRVAFLRTLVWWNNASGPTSDSRRIAETLFPLGRV